MNRRIAAILIVAGVLLDAGVILSPLTSFPLVQMVFDHAYLDAKHGYDEFLQRGTWQAGDRGFEEVQKRYLEDVLSGWRPQLDRDVMDGLTLDALRMENGADAPANPEKRKVYVIYSNQQGHIVEGDQIKQLTASFRRSNAMLANIALLLCGTLLVYRGLLRLLPAQGLNPPENGPSASEKSRLSRNAAS